MANMYMKIGDQDGKGDATAKYTGDAGVSEGGWFAIRSFNWGAARSVSMDIGNGMNRDAGMVAMSEISVSKEMDGSSEKILSRMYVPGEAGDVVQIIVTKPARTGQGAEVYLSITLENARIVNYSLSASDGATPFENLALSYSKHTVKHWHEEEGGNLVAGGDVTYNLPTGVAESHAISG